MNIDFKPLPIQAKVLNYLFDNITNEIYFVGGAGSSKSYLGAAWITILAISRMETSYIIGRSTLTSIKKSTIPTFLEVFKNFNLTTEQYTLNSSDFTITFFNGSKVYFIEMIDNPSDPEFQRFGSIQIHAAFIDEAAQISLKAKNILKSRIRQKIDDYKTIPKILIVANPNRTNFIYDIYLDSVNKRLPDSVKLIHSTVYDNSYMSDSYIDILKSLDNVSRKRLLEGSFEYSDDDDSLFLQEQVLLCFNNQYIQPDNRNILTCDVAGIGTNADNIVITIWEGLKLIKIEKPKLNTYELSNYIRNLMIQYNININNVIVDAVGIGKGVADNLKCKEFIGNKSSSNGLYKNIKTECFYKLSEYIRDRKIELLEEHRKDIMRELDCIKKHNEYSDSKLQINSKDEQKSLLGRSPDYADAISFRMYFEIYKGSGFSVGKIKR